MILGCVTDEISMDPEYAVKTGIKKGIYHYEIRKVKGFRIPFFSGKYENLLKSIRDRYGIEYTAVSPGFFKSGYFKTSGQEVYEKVFRLALLLQVKRIIIFTCKSISKEDDYKCMIDNIYNFTKKADKEGFTVCLENSANTCCCTGEETAEMIKTIGAGNLKANWDPGNAAIKGYLDYRTGYRALKDHIDNVHIKDVGRDGKSYKYVPVGKGLIDYRNQIRDLYKDGYTGCITIETHCSPSEPAFLESAEYLKRIILNKDKNNYY